MMTAKIIPFPRRPEPDPWADDPWATPPHPPQRLTTPEHGREPWWPYERPMDDAEQERYEAMGGDGPEPHCTGCEHRRSCPCGECMGHRLESWT